MAYKLTAAQTSTETAIAAKVFCTRTALEVANRAFRSSAQMDSPLGTGSRSCFATYGSR
jgi:hypothetical protein